MTKPYPPGHAALICALAFTAVPAFQGAPAHAQAVVRVDLNRRVNFDIPAQPLSSALMQFSRQTGLDLSASTDLIEGKQAGPLKGAYSAVQALRTLLRGTGLQFSATDTGVAIVAVPQGEDHKAGQSSGSLTSNTVRLAQTDVLQPTDNTSAADSDRGRKPDTSSTTVDGTKLEEILVTARRREEIAQTVPVAVTVVSQQTLQDNNIQTVLDLQQLIPSMSVLGANVGRHALNVSIRGQGNSTTSSVPGVVAYLNEVPLPGGRTIPGGPGLLFDLENVQVLKGPQGTLFGRNTTGGALLLQSARPGNSLEGHVQLGYGNYDNREIDAALNLPIASDKLLTRFAFTAQQRDGFTRLLGDPGHPNGLKADDRDDWAVRGTVTFRPSERFQNDLIVTYSKFSSHGSPSLLTDLNPTSLTAAFIFPGLSAAFAQQQALGIRTGLAVDNVLESKGHHLLLSNVSRIPLTDSLTFRNIVGYGESNTVFAFDQDGAPFQVVSLGLIEPLERTERQLTEEAQLLGNAFAGRLEWIAGAFYLDAPMPERFSTQTARLIGQLLDFESRLGNSSKALFAQGDYALTDALKLTAGVRYTWDKIAEDDRGGAFGQSQCTEPRQACDTITANSADSSALSWTAGMSYQAASDKLLYLTARRGYRGGGFNSPSQITPGFGPEYVNDYELGVKADWNAGNAPIRTNAALYFQDYKDIQVQELIVRNDGSFTAAISNAGAARIWGAELETQLQLTRNLNVGVNFDWLHFNYTQFESGVTPDTQATLEATRNANRPRYKYGVNARYRLPLSAEAGDLSLRATWSWQARNELDQVQPGGIVDSYGLLNVSANWDGIFGSGFAATVFASNLTDEKYKIGATVLYDSVLGFSSARYGEPRMYGMRLRYHFGTH